MDNTEVQNTMRQSAYTLVKHMLMAGVPFGLVIWNNNDWDYELPEEILSMNKDQIQLDISGYSLESSFIEGNQVYLKAAFGDQEYTKALNPGDIFAIIDEKGRAMAVNEFGYKAVEIEDTKTSTPQAPKNKKELIEQLEQEGLTKEGIEKSLAAFAKHNKGKFGILEK